MVDTIAMSANAERVIKPRTFISPKPGLRRRVCVARSSLRLPRAAVKRPRFRRGLVSRAQRRLQITSNGNHAQPGRFIFATIRGSRLLQGCDGVIVGSHSGSSGAPRAVQGVLRVRNLVGGPGFEPGASRSRITRQFIQTCRFLRFSVRFFKSTRPELQICTNLQPDYYIKYYRMQVVQTGLNARRGLNWTSTI